jgi:hypothetical protein
VLNADDEYLPHAAAWAVEQLARYPEAAVVYGDQYHVDEYGNTLYLYQGPNPYRFERVFCVEDIPPAQAAFIRRAHLEQVGLYADTSLARCPDYEMWVRIGQRFPMRYAPGVLARYRLHAASGGMQCRSIDRMVEAKTQVIERVVRDPKTSPAVRALRARALAGNYLWGAMTKKAGCGHMSEVFAYLVRSALVYRSGRHRARIARMLAEPVTRPLRRTGWRAERAWGSARTRLRRNRGARWGVITASPGRLVERLSSVGATTVRWWCFAPSSVEVRVDAPDGPLFAGGPPEGQATTGRWVAEGTTFYLQDVSDGRPLTAEHTLDKVTVMVDTPCAWDT